MSEMYEAVVVRGQPPDVRSAFADLRSPLALHLARLGEAGFGVYRVAARHEPFDQAGVADVARQMALRLGSVLAVFYDNKVGTRSSLLFAPCGVREFGIDDERWVSLREDGTPASDGPSFRADELDDDREYDCVVSAIDAGLAALGVTADVTSAALKQAFCYGEPKPEAERGGDRGVRFQVPPAPSPAVFCRPGDSAGEGTGGTEAQTAAPT